MSVDDDFAEFAATRWRRLVHAAMALGCGLHEAEDLVQTTLMRAFVAWPKVVRADNTDAYVARMLLNGFRASRRRRWRGEEPTEHLPEPQHVPHGESDDLATTLAERDAMTRALASLTVEQREVIALRHLAQLSESDTASALGVPPGTVKSRLARALAALATNPHLMTRSRA